MRNFVAQDENASKARLFAAGPTAGPKSAVNLEFGLPRVLHSRLLRRVSTHGFLGNF